MFSKNETLARLPHDNSVMAGFWLSAVAQPSTIDNTAFHAFKGSSLFDILDLKYLLGLS